MLQVSTIEYTTNALHCLLFFNSQVGNCPTLLTRSYHQAPQLSLGKSLTQLLPCHAGGLHPICYLLERDIPCEIWAAVLRLHIDGERREAAIVGCAELIRRDILCSLKDLLADALC